MTRRADSDDYRGIFLSGVALLDTRAPLEFARGAFPHTVNLPLMSDAERHEVGICYKSRGQQAAIELGQQLVSGELRAQRLAGWRQFALDNPQGYLYCFRGGLRSQTVQQWLAEAGVDYPLVRGGYKAMRQFLLAELPRSLQRADIVLVAGMTGSGKTRVIEALTQAVDLEGLAGHRGSTFGQLLDAQPSQIDFENALSIALMRRLAGAGRRVLLEDEGRLIGRLYLPEALREAMKTAPMAVVEESLASRTALLVEDYVIDLGQRYAARYGEAGGERHRDKLLADLLRIRKRLGGERHLAISKLLQRAFEHQWHSGDLALHRQWISALLEQYYDPMYRYQLDKRSGRQLFRGSRDEVIAWAGGAR